MLQCSKSFEQRLAMTPGLAVPDDFGPDLLQGKHPVQGEHPAR
jgi:hypothetical protein